MKDPLKLLREKRTEIANEFKRLVHEDAYSILGRNRNDAVIKEYKDGLKADKKELKEHLDKYDKAINILFAIKNETFEF